jgi:hypothetical protein
MTKKWGKGCTEHYGRIEDEREWYFFSENSNLTPEHLHNFKDLFSWEILSKNQALQISKDILSRYAEKWDYSEILKRDDIDWDIDVFCRIFNYFNWDIIKANESKIMEILQLEENTILNYFSFVKTYRRPLHREVYGSFVQSREERDNKIIMNAEVCGKALEESNLLNMDDFNELWEWLKRYMNLYYDHSELSKRLIRFPSNTRASDPYINTEDKIRGFFFKYEIIKKRLDRLFEEK